LHLIEFLIVNYYLYLHEMKKHSILIVLLLVICLQAAAKKPTVVERKKSQVCLTLQAENGSVKQKVNEDGTITCIIKSSDLIRVSSIVLNGVDLTSQLEKNKLNLPLLTKNSTLEIYFDEIPYYDQVEYTTMAMN